ncbi:MFS transporter [Mycobacterium heckeshornense]|uniref:MFS transporter n=1 Tax=Mycobacterium heckeshornense TaxID=110505 RepID=UPI0006626ACA|nr:MFS transporter [Mycobacterium heckeshornense]KMV22645.1 MFS transporter [Mycobacterium heckeshornense]MCV7034308.1 MFS transporter [Mycobacterium heckeshornense]PIJ32392.1 MFS transporter [Mycobacterium heckeshornense]
MEVGFVVQPRAPVAIWRSARGLPDFWRLLELRVASQFGDGLFQAALAGALLFNPERATNPLAIAGAFAVLFLPYSLLGPFAGALMDRWDRRLVLVGANIGRLGSVAAVGAALAVGANDWMVLCGALIVNGFGRFVSSGLSAALPHVVPRHKVVTMNSLANATGAVAAFGGANFMLLPRWLIGAGDSGSASIIFLVAIPISIALTLSLRFASHALGPDDSNRAVRGSVVYAVVTGWLHGVRTVLDRPTVAATLSGLATHRMVFGVNTLLVLVLVRHAGAVTVAGLGTAVLFLAATGAGSFLANALTPPAVRRWNRFTVANGALAAGAIIQIAGASLQLAIMVLCGFLLGVIGQVVKLCADTAMQIDVEDVLRGHVFTVQDSLFWVSFISAVTVAALVIPDDGRSPALVLAGSLLYLAGLGVHALVARRGQAVSSR